ncbi:MYXO-CTERM sorting domain-containing protein [Pseudenhygromyxa sp. WMMC2535]|uniref:MYXO-CTERM sorting domain-containing protein n=1 Tax=Pseudenhygromyxa sp. WMMC2535 TaxID=2712867 RepID=UPI001558074F|nr:MYXO-CTERM sorting domain-containing protein [Pseudenhygromyxa sp. WMMC2535]NVB42245.1 MYXO-CTERM sorting domain-containing protein [Pseudenhygromyxa sp. WMMC2535]
MRLKRLSSKTPLATTLILGTIAAAGISGCDYYEYSDNHHWSFVFDDLPDRMGFDNKRVLVGTDFSVSPGARSTIRDQAFRDECVVLGASGVLEYEDGIFEVTQAGSGAVEFPALLEACPQFEGQLSEVPADSWTMIGVSADEAAAGWINEMDPTFGLSMVSPGPAGSFPDDVALPLSPTRVVADGTFGLRPVLTQPSADPRQEVRFSSSAAALSLPAHYEYLQDTDPDADSLSQYLLGTIPTGTRIDEATLDVNGHAFDLPAVEAVSVDQITSLELVPIYLDDDTEEREWTSPVAIAALARDDKGRRIFGFPVEWSVTRGNLRVAPSGEIQDFMLLEDSCREAPDEPEARQATMEAAIGDLVASVDMSWIALPRDGESLEIDPEDPACQSTGCDCSTTDDPKGSVAAVLGLGLLGLVRRRRRQHASK